MRFGSYWRKAEAARMAVNHRHANRFLVQAILVEGAVVSEQLSVVRREHDDRVVRDSVFLQRCQQLADQVIGAGDRGVVVRDQVAQVEAFRQSVAGGIRRAVSRTPEIVPLGVDLEPPVVANRPVLVVDVVP